jgi:hypothetical protein
MTTREITTYWEKLLGRPPQPPGPQYVLPDQIVVDRADVRAVIAALAKDRLSALPTDNGR